MSFLELRDTYLESHNFAEIKIKNPANHWIQTVIIISWIISSDGCNLQSFQKYKQCRRVKTFHWIKRLFRKVIIALKDRYLYNTCLLTTSKDITDRFYIRRSWNLELIHIYVVSNWYKRSWQKSCSTISRLICKVN